MPYAKFRMCPPGVDQTERMPQRWAILAPAIEQLFNLAELGPVPNSPKLPRYREVDPFDFCREKLSFKALQLLFTPPALDASTPPPLWDPALLSRPPSTTPSALERLPSELTHAILSHLDPADTVVLGLCSQRLWAHAVASIHDGYRFGRGAAPWARTPLVCTGNYLTDLPPSLKDMAPEVFAETEAWNANTGRRKGRCPARRWNGRARGYYANIGKDMEEECLAVFDEERVVNCGLEKQMLESMSGRVRRTWGLGVKHGSEAYLRNLSEKGFVRMRLVLGGAGAGRYTAIVDGASWLSLDVLLMLRFLWTRLNTWGDMTHGIRQGPWAGHCFDVVVARPEGSEWQDVTDAVVMEAETFQWKSGDHPEKSCGGSEQ